MSKTNFDDLDLAVPGIEADEINAEGAALGSSLKVGLNGVMEWGPSASVVVAEHSSEATIALTASVSEANSPFSLVADSACFAATASRRSSNRART